MENQLSARIDREKTSV